MHLGKMPLLAKVKKALGKRCRMHGLTSWKRNLYFNFQFGFPGWIRPVAGQAYVPLYQRAKIGFNVHNRGDFTVGNYRLFELPANGVMQISDGGEYLNEFFKVGEEIIAYKNADELIDLLHYYLTHDEERQQIALNGYRRVRRDHRIRDRLRQAGELIRQNIQQGNRG
jgi:spore maturation protein CgeB